MDVKTTITSIICAKKNMENVIFLGTTSGKIFIFNELYEKIGTIFAHKPS